jgi:hypothetical protein
MKLHSPTTSGRSEKSTFFPPLLQDVTFNPLLPPCSALRGKKVVPTHTQTDNRDHNHVQPQKHAASTFFFNFPPQDFTKKREIYKTELTDHSSFIAIMNEISTEYVIKHHINHMLSITNSDYKKKSPQIMVIKV